MSCAYEYGVPQASGQFYHGDGPYSGGVWKAERALDESGMILKLSGEMESPRSEGPKIMRNHGSDPF